MEHTPRHFLLGHGNGNGAGSGSAALSRNQLLVGDVHVPFDYAYQPVLRAM